MTEPTRPPGAGRDPNEPRRAFASEPPLEGEGDLEIVLPVPIANNLVVQNRIGSDGELKPNEAISSGDGNAKLVFCSDGVLRLADLANKRVLWKTSGTKGADRIVMQGDGNFVAYSGDKPIWATDTNGHPGAYLQLQDDRNCVIYGPAGNNLWDTGTALRSGGSVPTSSPTVTSGPGRGRNTPI